MDESLYDKVMFLFYSGDFLTPEDRKLYIRDVEKQYGLKFDVLVNLCTLATLKKPTGTGT